MLDSRSNNVSGLIKERSPIMQFYLGYIFSFIPTEKTRIRINEIVRYFLNIRIPNW